MKRHIYVAFALMIVVVVSLSLFAGNKPNDAFGRIDDAFINVTQLSPNQFAFELAWKNDQKLAAFTYPLHITGKSFKMHYDSVSWNGRASYFAVRSAHPIDSMQQIVVGFVNDLGQGKPPLPESTGTVATVFFTAEVKKANICDILVDTTFIPPSNVLYGVTPDGLGKVYPTYNVFRKGIDGKSVKCK